MLVHLFSPISDTFSRLISLWSSEHFLSLLPGLAYGADRFEGQCRSIQII